LAPTDRKIVNFSDERNFVIKFIEFLAEHEITYAFLIFLFLFSLPRPLWKTRGQYPSILYHPRHEMFHKRRGSDFSSLWSCSVYVKPRFLVKDCWKPWFCKNPLPPRKIIDKFYLVWCKGRCNFDLWRIPTAPEFNIKKRMVSKSLIYLSLICIVF